MTSDEKTDEKIDEQITEMIDSFVRDAMNAGGVAYSDESTLVGDLGFDSLDFVSFISAVEDTWDIVVPDEDFTAERFATVAAVRTYIKSRV